MYTIRATDRDRWFVVCRTPYLQKKKVAIQPPFYRSAFVYDAQEESPKWHWPNCFLPSLPFHMGEGKEKTLVIISQLGKLPLQGVSILPHRTSFPLPSKRTMTGQESEWFRGISQSKRGRRFLGAWGADPGMRMFAGMIRERNPKARRAKKILQERNIPFLFSYLKSTNDQAKRVSFFLRGHLSLNMGRRLLGAWGAAQTHAHVCWLHRHRNWQAGRGESEE